MSRCYLYRDTKVQLIPNGPPFELIYLVGKEENAAISLKYRVSKGIDMIFQGEISVQRYIAWSTSVNGIKRATVKSMCYSATTVPPILLLRGFEPQIFWFEVHPTCHLG